MLSRILSVINVMVSMSWPFIFYWAYENDKVMLITLLLFLLIVLRLVIAYINKASIFKNYKLNVAIGALCILALLIRSYDLMLYYPVLVNAVLLSVFALSLVNGPSFIERIARIKDPNLDARGIAYTKNLTIVWCVFFVINGSISLFTILSNDMELWTLYNGVISYLLIGALMVGEFIFRFFYLKRS